MEKYGRITAAFCSFILCIFVFNCTDDGSSDSDATNEARVLYEDDWSVIAAGSGYNAVLKTVGTLWS